MDTIYHVKGTLSKNFIGQISYVVCLEKTYRELDIEFSFSPQRFSPKDITPELKQELLDYCKKTYGLVPSSEEEINYVLFHEMKTELHTLATLNDTFIGGVHRQLTTRHMRFTPDSATDGCILQPCIEGVLKVTILAFSVLVDSTDYTLTVSAS